MTSRRQLFSRAAVGLLVAAVAGCSRHRVPKDRRQVYRYGDAKAQVAELLLPTGSTSESTSEVTTVVLVHGGYWQAGYDRSLEQRVAVDLVAQGFAVWNVDYRAVGDGGGWPASFTDVAAAVDLLADAAKEHGLSTERVLAVGHSAGGTFALWCAARPGLPDGAPGARPRVRVRGAVSQAGVNDLRRGSADRLGGGAVDQLIGGGPAEHADRYALADPSSRLPLGVPLLLLTGADDTVVPTGQTTQVAAAARAAGDDVQLDVVPGEGHFAHLDPGSRCWRTVRDWLLAHR